MEQSITADMYEEATRKIEQLQKEMKVFKNKGLQKAVEGLQNKNGELRAQVNSLVALVSTLMDQIHELRDENIMTRERLRMLRRNRNRSVSN